MKCEQAEELFSDYIENKTDPALTAALENHVSGCSSCKEGVASFRLVWKELSGIDQVEAPALLHSSIMARVDAERKAAEALPAERPAFSLRKFFRPPIMAAAAAALLLMLGFGAARTQDAAFWPFSLFQSRSAIKMERPTVLWQSAEGGLDRIEVRLSVPDNAPSGSIHCTIQAEMIQPGQPPRPAGSKEIDLHAGDTPEVSLPQIRSGQYEITVKTSSGQSFTLPLTGE